MKIKAPSSVKELLISLVRIPSVNKFISGKNDAEHNVYAYIKDIAPSFGLKARLLEVPGAGNNVLVTKEFDKNAPWIMFEAHMDTVSSEGMDFDPFAAEEKNGCIYGRGSSDDKGSLCAALWALKETAASGDSPNNIAVLGVVDEEQRHSGVIAFTKSQLSQIDFKPFGVIVAEPTSLVAIVSHAGIAHFSISVKGLAAHASDPTKGRSAIKGMVKVIDTLEKEYINTLRATDPLCGRACCSINMINGGRQVNAVPDLCTIRVDRRVMPCEKVEDVLPEVEKVLKHLSKSDPEIEISAKMDIMDDPLTQDQSDPFIQGVLSVLKNSGKNAAPAGAPFGTDAGTLSHAGFPCVVMGPGDDTLSHTSGEYMRLDELEEGVRIFKALMVHKF
jgi:acetylornithine deacetylase